MAGRFITLEGGEGAGKSTQLAALAAYLTASGCDVVQTREPGGTPGGEAVRALLVESSGPDWTDMSECLLMNAARAEHVEHVIRPALQSGKYVLCDRFSDSTRAYQGGAGRVAMATLLMIERSVTAGISPDLTIILDISVAQGLARARNRGDSDRFERKGTAYHEAVRQAFLDIAAKESDRCAVVAAAADPDQITKKIVELCRQRLQLGGKDTPPTHDHAL